MALFRMAAVCLLLAASAVSAQSYTCPDKPKWEAIPCSMHKAIQPEDAGTFSVTFTREAQHYREYLALARSSQARLHIYPHFKNPDLVAEWVARAWAGQPGALRRTVMPLVISVDAGSDGSPVYWDYTDDPGTRAHVVEFPAAYVHEDASTLDWSFEELLTHELCRLLDNKSGRISDQPGWRRAVSLDRGHVTSYAKTSNRADFAESCAAHILLAIGERLTEDHRKHVEETIGSRRVFFDSLFLLRSDVMRTSR